MTLQTELIRLKFNIRANQAASAKLRKTIAETAEIYKLKEHKG